MVSDILKFTSGISKTSGGRAPHRLYRVMHWWASLAGVVWDSCVWGTFVWGEAYTASVLLLQQLGTTLEISATMVCGRPFRTRDHLSRHVLPDLLLYYYTRTSDSSWGITSNDSGVTRVTGVWTSPPKV